MQDKENKKQFSPVNEAIKDIIPCIDNMFVRHIGNAPIKSLHKMSKQCIINQAELLKRFVCDYIDLKVKMHLELIKGTDNY